MDAVAGFPADGSGSAYLEDCERYVIPEFEYKGADFLIRVSGDSMVPLYYSGDLLACHKTSDFSRGAPSSASSALCDVHDARWAQIGTRARFFVPFMYENFRKSLYFRRILLYIIKV